MHDGEGHARIFIRQRHHGFIHPSPGHQLTEPEGVTKMTHAPKRLKKYNAPTFLKMGRPDRK